MYTKVAHLYIQEVSQVGELKQNLYLYYIAKA